MEHDVEVALTARMASLEATITGFAKDVQRRFDTQAEALDDIRAQTHLTNGRVTQLEQADAVRAAVANAVTSDARRLRGPSLITLSDFKWWVAIAIGCLTAGAGFTVWVLTLVGKL